MRTHLGQLVTGDRIIWRAGAAGGVVVAQLPRQTELVRPNPQGALRPVAQTENRLKEAQKLGFTSAIIPQQAKKAAVTGITLRQTQDLAGCVEELFGAR